MPVKAIIFIYFAFQAGGFRDVFKAATLKDARLWGLALFGVAAVAESFWYNYARFG